MKNIHVLPTDKPSRLFEILKFNFVFDNQNKYSEEYKKLHKYKNQNIYITNDEEIKEGDWCLDKFNQRWKLEDEILIAFDNKGIKRFSTDNILGHECKKIILTDNSDLIKDGVQAIDDEFLEWFVKNPSCEKVGVINTFDYNKKHFVEHSGYKIIISKEEPKQEMSARLQNSLTQFNLYIEEALELEDWKLKTIGFSNKSIIELRNLTPKQETLEEFIKSIYPSPSGVKIRGIELGAKWQQEQIYNQIKELYDNENITGFTKRAYAICLDIVEQFKKTI